MTNVISGINIYYYKSIRKPFLYFSHAEQAAQRYHTIWRLLMANTAVKIENLVKRYGEVIAVDHLNLTIREGEIFGLSVRTVVGRQLRSTVCFLFFPMIKETLKFSVRRSHRPIISSSHRSVLSCRMWRFSMN